ncbi:MAG: deoxyribonuclease IV [Elusimicrobiota bacterium]
MKTGAHCPINKGFTKAVDHILKAGGNTLQIFSGNPRAWKKKPIEQEEAEAFYEKRRKEKVTPLVIHASYMVNMGTSDEILWKRSVAALEDEILRSDILRADYLVVHAGTNPDRDAGLKRHIEAVKQASDTDKKVKLLIENSAGQGNSLLSDLDSLAELVRKSYPSGTGLCIDTAHAFQAGYSPEALIKNRSAAYAEIIHANDSKTPMGSRVDRHEHIGQGKIGKTGFRKILNNPAWKDLPFILETPWEDGMDKKNIKQLKALRRD